MTQPDNDILGRHLRDARAELLRQRVRIDADIQEIDRLVTARSIRVHNQPAVSMSAAATLTTSGHTSSSGMATVTAQRDDDDTDEVPAGRRGLTGKAAILEVLRSDSERDWQLNEIVTAVHEMGVTAKPESIRSIISRVIHAGEAVKGTSGRSSYRLAPAPAADLWRDVVVSSAADEARQHAQGMADASTAAEEPPVEPAALNDLGGPTHESEDERVSPM